MSDSVMVAIYMYGIFGLLVGGAWGLTHHAEFEYCHPGSKRWRARAVLATPLVAVLWPLALLGVFLYALKPVFREAFTSGGRDR